MVYKFPKVKVQDLSWKLKDFGAFPKFKSSTNRRRCKLTSPENVTKSVILNKSYRSWIWMKTWVFFLRKKIRAHAATRKTVFWICLIDQEFEQEFEWTKIERWVFFLRKNVQDKSPRNNASDDRFSCRLEKQGLALSPQWPRALSGQNSHETKFKISIFLSNYS